ncbi:MAG TPA: zinc-ribbon domain-containing protein [Pirellulaceae bacterium]|nr:zinc-ribbon domain-containing protein [Pirellulaceae bacterium]
MPISLSCPACQKAYNVPDTLAAKQVKCQQCSHVFIVFAPQPVTHQPVGLDPLFSGDLPPLGAPLPSANFASLPAGGLGAPLSPEGRPLG